MSGGTSRHHLATMRRPSLLSSPKSHDPRPHDKPKMRPSRPTRRKRPDIGSSFTFSKRPSVSEKMSISIQKTWICLYRAEHPKSTQAEIAGTFGTDRRTIGKILHDKEKYLPKDGSVLSYTGNAKGRSADFKRVLATWARKQLESGFPLSDQIIREGALAFALATRSCELQRAISDAWIENFKTDFHLMSGRSQSSSLSPSKTRDVTASPSDATDFRSSTRPPSDSSVSLREYGRRDIVSRTEGYIDRARSVSTDPSRRFRRKVISADAISGPASSRFARTLCHPPTSLAHETGTQQYSTSIAQDTDALRDSWLSTDDEAHSFEFASPVPTVVSALDQGDALRPRPRAETINPRNFISPTEALSALEVVVEHAAQRQTGFLTFRERVFLGKLAEKIRT